MQNKGALKLLVILLGIACAFQLSFSFVTYNVQKKAEGMDAIEQQAYFDSMKSETVYNLGLMKYTYAECLDKEINLGLDLRGGMNVTLEIAVEDIVTALAGSNATKPEFQAAVVQARKNQANSTKDFLTLFVEAYQSANPGGQLATIFGTTELREKIKPSSSNDEVIKVIRAESESAIANSFNVLSNRINRFGVTQPNIQRLGNSGRILVELPGVKDPERVRKLLQGTASLEFWTVYTAEEMSNILAQVNQYVITTATTDTTKMAAGTATSDTTKMAAATSEGTKSNIATDSSKSIVAALAQADSSGTLAGKTAHSLFSVLQPFSGDSQIIGLARSFDTVKVNEILNKPQVRALLPRDVKFMWSIKPMKDRETGKYTNDFELYAIKGTSSGKAPLDGASVANADAQHSGKGSAAEVSMAMNAIGAKTWARLTADNVGKYIAIVLDDYVYSCPRVNGEIAGGRSSITGDFTIQEAKDLANVLKSGKLPAPARIVQESIVGPTLGQESINSGISSFVIAFALVLLYMMFFYSKAGMVASLALIANLFLLFGVLVSFGAVLTLPGIAGIVLTMGMAVDANVVIYERIKEELRAGKAMSLAVKDGFYHAYSAIIDGNMTTMITGIVLFIFGTGPVQGFATTLVIGILTSLFCAIFITRIIFEAYLAKGKNITFSNKLTQNFLANTKVNFINIRRITYVVSIATVIVVVASLATRGLQYGIDFTGGRTYVIRFDKDVTANDVRETLSKVFVGEELIVKQYGAKEQKQMSITTQYKYNDENPATTNEINLMMYNALKPMYSNDISEGDFMTTVQNPLGIISAEKVNASIAHDIVVNSFIAVFIALLLIGLYIAVRFKRWQYGMGAVLSLAHDALLAIGLFSLLHSVLPFNLSVDQSFIAAILTIIGYSINDTVIIFDRIRENIKIHPKLTLKESMNNAMNQTLTRTVNTAGTTLVVLIAMFLFGGEVIRGFIFALLSGVVLGTFSSIFVASPIAYDLMTWSDKRKANKQMKA